jgi:hypothetical protein
MDELGRDGDVISKCYQYVLAYPYSGRSGSAYPSGNWAAWWAEDMYNYHSGNCFGYAALLAVLLQYNGFSAKAITGYVQLRNGLGPHGWVEYYHNGATYVLDAEAPHDIPGRNFYMITYANAPIRYVK